MLFNHHFSTSILSEKSNHGRKFSAGFSSAETNSIETGNAVPENLIPDQNRDYPWLETNGPVLSKQPYFNSYSGHPDPKPVLLVSNPAKLSHRPLGSIVSAQKTFFAEDESSEEVEVGEGQHEVEHEEHGGILSGNTPVSSSGYSVI